MITKSEDLQYKIDMLNIKSQELKDRHVHGDWDNWRLFTNYDIRIKELTIELLQLDIVDLNDSILTYIDY